MRSALARARRQDDTNRNGRGIWRDEKLISVARVINDGHGTNPFSVVHRYDVQVMLSSPRLDNGIEV